MKKLLLPLVLLIVGSGGGIGAGLFLFPPAHEAEPELANPCGPLPEEPAAEAAHEGATEEEILAAAAEGGESLTEGYEYVKLANQFIVPVVQGADVAALVLLSMSLEVPLGQNDHALEVEPKLRDAFLQVLFDHANTGQFDGVFTATGPMRTLRSALLAAAEEAEPGLVRDVLITDIVRQDVGAGG